MTSANRDDFSDSRRFYSCIYGVLAGWAALMVFIVVEVCK